MSQRSKSEGLLDWTVLKYGWLLVFAVHGIFLWIGMTFLRSAAYSHNTALYSPEQLRISQLLDSMYMFAIAFSLLLVILAVFVLEIFRATQKILMELQELKASRDLAVPQFEETAAEDL